MLVSLLYNFTPPGCRSCIKSSFLNVVFLMVSLIQWSHMVLQEIVCQIFRFIVINTLSPISNNDIFLYSDALISSSLLYLCMWSFVVAVFTASSSTECLGKEYCIPYPNIIAAGNSILEFGCEKVCLYDSRKTFNVCYSHSLYSFPIFIVMSRVLMILFTELLKGW